MVSYPRAATFFCAPIRLARMEQKIPRIGSVRSSFSRARTQASVRTIRARRMGAEIKAHRSGLACHLAFHPREADGDEQHNSRAAAVIPGTLRAERRARIGTELCAVSASLRMVTRRENKAFLEIRSSIIRAPWPSFPAHCGPSDAHASAPNYVRLERVCEW